MQKNRDHDILKFVDNSDPETQHYSAREGENEIYPYILYIPISYHKDCKTRTRTILVNLNQSRVKAFRPRNTLPRSEEPTLTCQRYKK